MSDSEQPAADDTAAPGPDAKAEGSQPEAGEDDVRAKFREALAAKQAGQPHLGGTPRTGPAPSHSAAARPTRRFRRKSG